MKDKFNIIIKPYLIWLILFLVGYTFLHWLFIIKLQIGNWDDTSTNSIISFGTAILSGFIAWIPLRLRLTILNLHHKLKDLYTMVAWLTLTVPTIVAQHYIETATGKLTSLNTISEISSKPITKYYTLKDGYIDNYSLGIHKAGFISGKHNERLTMKTAVTMPIFDKAEDTASHNPPAWLGFMYSKTIDNKLNEEKKRELELEFGRKCQDSLEKTDVTKFVYLKRIEGNPDKYLFARAISYEEYNQHNSYITLMGVNEPFSERNGNKLKLILIFLAAGSTLYIGMVLGKAVNPWKLEEYKRTGTTKENKQTKKFLKDISLPQKNYFATPIILYSNLLIYFLLTVIGTGIMNISNFQFCSIAGNYGPLSFGKEPWRLLTSIFLHGNFVNFILSTVGILFAGIILEKHTGRKRLFAIYILSGISTSITSALWHWNEPTLTVNASGTALGMAGALIALSITRLVNNDRNYIYIAYATIYIALTIIIGAYFDIDHAVNISGVVSGLIIGLIMANQIKQTKIR